MQRITIIDDDVRLMQSIKSFLKKRGFHVSIFSDGSKAMHSIKRNPPDLIILEAFLNSFDGLDFCNTLKTYPPTRLIPVVVCSAFSKVGDTVVFEYGASEFVEKSFSAREFASRVYNSFPVSLKERSKAAISHRKNVAAAVLKKAFTFRVVAVPAFALFDAVGFLIKKLSPGRSRKLQLV